MGYQERLLAKIANEECERVAEATISHLKKTKKGMQSGDDSGLKNLWEEICVQVQEEMSVMWDAYEQLMFQELYAELKNTPESIKQAIWLETDEGMDNYSQYESGQPIHYDEAVIALYIASDYLLRKAADFTNDRIEQYLEDRMC